VLLFVIDFPWKFFRDKNVKIEFIFPNRFSGWTTISNFVMITLCASQKSINILQLQQMMISTSQGLAQFRKGLITLCASQKSIKVKVNKPNRSNFFIFTSHSRWTTYSNFFIFTCKKVVHLNIDWFFTAAKVNSIQKVYFEIIWISESIISLLNN
jgi:hypothetical protein